MTCESANCEDHVTFFHSCYIKLKIINTNNEPHKQTVRNTIHGLHMDCRPQVIHACCVSSSVNHLLIQGSDKFGFVSMLWKNCKFLYLCILYVFVVEHHNNGGNFELAHHIELWRGNVTEMLKEMARRKQLSDLLVSFAPLASQRWVTVLHLYYSNISLNAYAETFFVMLSVYISFYYEINLEVNAQILFSFKNGFLFFLYMSAICVFTCWNFFNCFSGMFATLVNCNTHAILD